MSIWRWSEWLPEIPAFAQISLGEGDTPLVRSRRIGPAAGLNHLFFKIETGNPTGSYKDRFAAAAISHMLANHQTHCIATSSGNTGSALAAYCAAASLRCEIAIVETAPLGKLQQMLAYGADLYRVRGFGLDANITQAVFEHLESQATAADAALQISAFRYSPLGMSGVKTLSYEIAEQMEGQLDHVFSPSGGGGLTLAVARGFNVVAQKGRLARSPRIECVQPRGNDTIAGPLRAGEAQARSVTCTTQVSGLQVANVIDGHETLAACRQSGGTGHLVDDEFVWEVQTRMAKEEGIFCEPAGAVALAGALRAMQEGELSPEARVVCLVTGSGFKDPTALKRMTAELSCPIHDLASLIRGTHGEAPIRPG